MNQPNETRMTVIEVRHNQVHTIHPAEMDADYLPLIVLYTEQSATAPVKQMPFNAYYMWIDGQKFWIVADPDNNTWHLTRDICRASLYDSSTRPSIPCTASPVPAQYFDGYSHTEINPRVGLTLPPALAPLPPALPHAPSSAMAEPTVIDGWTHVKIGDIILTIHMPDTHTAEVYLFVDDILTGPQFTIVKQADNSDGSHNAMMWLPTIGITGADGIFFTSGKHSQGDFIGAGERAVEFSADLGQLTIKRRA